MRNFNLDRLKFRWQGDWVADFAYRKDDIVYYEGKAFVCLKSHQSAENFYDDRNAEDVDININVTVSVDSLNNQPQGNFYLDGEEAPDITLLKGRKYIFDQSDDSNILFDSLENIFFISNVEDGTQSGGIDFQSGVQYFLDNSQVNKDNYILNFSNSSTRRIEFTVPATAPERLYYYSNNSLGMGGVFDTRYSSYWDLMSDGYSWKGDWQPSIFYPEGSIVKYNGYLYLCIESHSATGVVTLGLPADIDNWIIYATTYNWLNEWTTAFNYELGDVVRYNGRTYICSAKHLSASTQDLGLEENQSDWTLVTRSDNWRTNWTPTTRYQQDDVVKYGGIVYRCLGAHTSADNFSLGLETDIILWENVISGIEYKQNWSSTTRYKLNDVVKYGPSLWKCTSGHTSTTFRADEVNWEIYIPGLEYEDVWNSEEEYQKGDIVFYGGYTYTALQNNINSVPSVNGKLQNTGDWELLTTGYSYKGEWESETQYRTGNVVTNSGYLYIAISDSFAVYPDSDNEVWEVLSKGQNFKGEWADDTEYFLDDIVLWKGSTYICINRHTSTASDSRPDLDQDLDVADYWTLLIKGAENNTLANRGDIKIYESGATNLSIGLPGSVLKTKNGLPTWENYGTTRKVYYVSPFGTDSDAAGVTESAPFRSIRYACEFILEDEENRSPATVFIKTGEYEEELPISVPANVALVGDELRSTAIKPQAGFEKSDMFRVRNGSGIRNMTLKGLSGELGPLNEFLTRRPDTGAYVSLDPGTGPADESVWITTKSCYVQNVTTLGTACIGMKVDGALHEGGNRSIVANDFTQVLSDGIGYWADNGGRSELVSVFTYFCHIGYLSTNGGIVRATNGNNSYGLYGSVAEGFNQQETPKSAVVDNRRNDAQFSEAVTFGTSEQKILAIGYSHAGQDYTVADIEFGGAGLGAQGRISELRNNAISNIRLLTPEDSSLEGGAGYTNRINNAQLGSDKFIRIAQADIGTPQEYIGQRIRIISGLGVGQYAEISAFDEVTKNIIVSKESNGTNGWDHFQPGYPIEPELDETTRYAIEPKVTVQEPRFDVFNVDNPDASEQWHFVDYGNEWLAVTKNQTSIKTSTSSDATTWTSPVEVTANEAASVLFNDDLYYILPTTGTSVFTSSDGINWLSSSLSTGSVWYDIAGDGDKNLVALGDELLYRTESSPTFSNVGDLPVDSYSFELLEHGKNKFVAISIGDGASATSETGAEWTVYENAVPTYSYTDLVYGNNRFVTIAPASDSTDQITRTAISFDGITWHEGAIEEGDFEYISYSQGLFVATGAGSAVAKSQDGISWKLVADDSTPFSLTVSASWKKSASDRNGSWIVVNDNGNSWNKIETGSRPVIRASMIGSRIQELVIYDPGSNYNEGPVVEILDNSVNTEAFIEVNVNSGVIPQPEILDRGEGYTTATADITGDGFAEIYQTGKELKVKSLSDLAGPGANINILGIDDERYSLVTIQDQIPTDNGFEATLLIDPPIGNFESPDHETEIVIREEYSQIRLTGHDFLDIGTGNVGTTRYPELYLEGETAENDRKPFNETSAQGGGRVFYTSTDQEGNFRVGELFEVEQAQGIVTINASQFDLSGLTELSLGGIQVGGTQVVVREFSRDTTFVANSNNVVPTQAAIKEYISRQVSGGGANAQANILIAGQIQIDTNRITTTSGFSIQNKQVTQIKGGIEGHYLALQYFATGGNFSGLENG